MQFSQNKFVGISNSLLHPKTNMSIWCRQAIKQIKKFVSEPLSIISDTRSWLLVCFCVALVHIPVHAMGTHGRVEVWLHAFPTKHLNFHAWLQSEREIKVKWN